MSESVQTTLGADPEADDPLAFTGADPLTEISYVTVSTDDETGETTPNARHDALTALGYDSVQTVVLGWLTTDATAIIDALNHATAERSLVSHAAAYIREGVITSAHIRAATTTDLPADAPLAETMLFVRLFDPHVSREERPADRTLVHRSTPTAHVLDGDALTPDDLPWGDVLLAGDITDAFGLVRADAEYDWLTTDDDARVTTTSIDDGFTTVKTSSASATFRTAYTDQLDTLGVSLDDTLYLAADDAPLVCAPFGADGPAVALAPLTD
jgi:hypothetical protein